jgi:hypothetical protein
MPAPFKFRVIVVGGPCDPYIERCLDSLTAQTDKEWTAAVVLDKHDDAPSKAMLRSTAGITVAINYDQKRGAMPNIVRSILLQRPDPDDVLVTLDGDDWLNSTDVLAKVRALYDAQSDLLLTYGSWVGYPDPNCVNNSAPYMGAEFVGGILRKGPWRGSHLRTFKYRLWQKVKDEDMRGSDGMYYDCAWDLAFMWPMLEMAGYDRVKWVKDPLYVYNRETPHNDEKLRSARQTAFMREIQAKPPYSRVVFDDLWPSGVKRHLWDCCMCGEKQCMESSHEYHGRANGNVSEPAGVCTCSKCGRQGLACPDARGYPGPAGSVAPSLPKVGA